MNYFRRVDWIGKCMYSKMAGSAAFCWIANATEVERFFFTTGVDTAWSFGRVSHDLSEPPTLRRESNIEKNQFVKMTFVAVNLEGYMIFEKVSKRNLHFFVGVKEKSSKLNLDKFRTTEGEVHRVKLFCKITVYPFLDSKPKASAGAAVDGSSAEPRRLVNALSKAENFVSLSQDMHTLFDCGNFSDAVLSCGSKEIKVHKAILSARSPVFAAMFSHQMKESIHNSVEITDVDEDVLLKMVTFIYTGVVVDSGFDAVRGLYIAAEKYHMPGLKNTCRHFLQHKITLDTITDVLVLVDMFQDWELKMCAMNFIVEHFQQIRSCESWEVFLREHQHLGLEILNTIMNALVPQKS